MRNQFLSTSSNASRIKQLTSVRRLSSHNKQSEEGNYSIGHGLVDAERAPSTAQEFIRVAEEKTRQTAEKALDGAVAGESTVKEVMKENPGKGDFHKDKDK